MHSVKLPPSLVRPVHQAQVNQYDSSSSTTILQDLERCSEVMGVESLVSKREDLVEVSRRAQLFLDSIRPLLPSEFSREYKNPCWMAEKPKVNSSRFISKPVIGDSREGVLLCLPYFFLAGFPKSATTTVHEALRKLPQIAGPAGKEPHWWTRALGLSKLQEFDADQLRLAFIAYTRFFEKIGKLSKSPDHDMDMITYDGSQSTLWDSNFYYNSQDYCAMPAIVSRILPDARFIVVLRNPVTRLYSHYLYSCRLHYGSEKRWPSAIKEEGINLFHSQVEKDIDNFNQCLETMSEFECASIRSSSMERTELINSSQLHCGVVWHRLSIGMYIVHIKKWLQFFPLENFLFLKMEDISEDPTSTIFRIAQFLDVTPIPSEVAEGIFGQPQNTLNSNSLPMDESTRVLLEQFYQPYNEELARMLDDEHFLWAT